MGKFLFTNTKYIFTFLSMALYLKKYDTNAKITWQQFQNNNNFYDITLACDDKQILTHKLVLTSSSSVLSDILKQNIDQHPLVYFPGVKYGNLLNLINFMYQGAINIAVDNLDNLLQLAHYFQINPLLEAW